MSNSPCFSTLRKRNVRILLQSAFPLPASHRFLDSRRMVREFRDMSYASYFVCVCLFVVCFDLCCFVLVMVIIY